MFYIKWHDEEKFYSMPIRRISKDEKQKQKLCIHNIKITFYLLSKQIFRIFVQLIMSLRTRIICFEAQETIIMIIDLYKFKRSEVTLTWLIIDPKVN